MQELYHRHRTLAEATNHVRVQDILYYPLVACRRAVCLGFSLLLILNNRYSVSCRCYLRVFHVFYIKLLLAIHTNQNSSFLQYYVERSLLNKTVEGKPITLKFRIKRVNEHEHVFTRSEVLTITYYGLDMPSCQVVFRLLYFSLLPIFHARSFSYMI